MAHGSPNTYTFMETKTAFDLNTAIQRWRDNLSQSPHLSPGEPRGTGVASARLGGCVSGRGFVRGGGLPGGGAKDRRRARLGAGIRQGKWPRGLDEPVAVDAGGRPVVAVGVFLRRHRRGRDSDGRSDRARSSDFKSATGQYSCFRCSGSSGLLATANVLRPGRLRRGALVGRPQKRQELCKHRGGCSCGVRCLRSDPCLCDLSLCWGASAMSDGRFSTRGMRVSSYTVLRDDGGVYITVSYGIMLVLAVIVAPALPVATVLLARRQLRLRINS